MDNTTIQTFGHRSLIYRLVATLVAYIVAIYFGGVIGFFFILFLSFYMNYEALDSMKIILTDDLLHITRYVPTTKYDCNFWLKDIAEAGIYLKKKFGKAKHPDGSVSSSGESWHQLHIILKDGSEHEVPLLGMKPFERDKLKKALEEKGIPSFEIAYRLKEGGTLHP